MPLLPKQEKEMLAYKYLNCSCTLNQQCTPTYQDASTFYKHYPLYNTAICRVDSEHTGPWISAKQHTLTTGLYAGLALGWQTLGYLQNKITCFFQSYQGQQTSRILRTSDLKSFQKRVIDKCADVYILKQTCETSSDVRRRISAAHPTRN